MALFAKLDEDNIVTTVIVVADDCCGGGVMPQSELTGQEFIASMGLEGTWKQTGDENEFRGESAGIGSRYDAAADIFIVPQPYSSWTLDETHDWQPPTPMPLVGRWGWDEATLAWVEVVL